MLSKRPDVQTIQQTAKIFKLAMLIGFLLMLLSPIACVGACAALPPIQLDPAVDPETSDSALAGFLFLGGLAQFVVGFGVLVVAKILAWWHHA